ncbi:MAG: hypothetical protein ACR2I2_12945 [Bryobacteraceae bacterium]
MESKKDRAAAKREYHAAIAGFETLGSAGISADFHVKYAQALLNLAFLNEVERNYKGAVPLLLRAVGEHKAAGSKAKIAWDYCELALAYRGLGLRAKASEAIRNASGLFPELTGVDRKDVEDELDQVKRERRTAHSDVEP